MCGHCYGYLLSALLLGEKSRKKCMDPGYFFRRELFEDLIFMPANDFPKGIAVVSRPKVHVNMPRYGKFGLWHEGTRMYRKIASGTLIPKRRVYLDHPFLELKRRGKELPLLRGGKFKRRADVPLGNHQQMSFHQPWVAEGCKHSSSLPKDTIARLINDAKRTNPFFCQNILLKLPEEILT